MKLCDVLRILREEGESFELIGDADVELTGVTNHTSQVRRGYLYVCVKGARFDGHELAGAAIEAGAVALVVARPLEHGVPQVVVADPRRLMGKVSSILCGRPSRALKVVGVTGTNGKTTTTFMLRSILMGSGFKVGLMGTVVYSDGEEEVEADRTTPESWEVQGWMRRALDRGCAFFVMEASSHGLQMDRLVDVSFEASAFTNLTPEHLDFHGTMENYYQAKRSLFFDYTVPDGVRVVNVDDEWGLRLCSELKRAGLPVLSLSLLDPSADFFAAVEGVDMRGARAQAFEGGRPVGELIVPMIGRYNVYNALTAYALARGLGISVEWALRGIRELKRVPGRVEVRRLSNGAWAVIDYAHSPDALEKLISAAREAMGERGRLLALFGFGGDRYLKNAWEMGKLAAERCDFVVITMDNPRFDDPMEIARHIEAGVIAGGGRGRYAIEIDRKEAIRRAVRFSRDGDVLLLAGKGPETYMVVGDEHLPYNEERALREVLEEEGLGLEVV